MSYEFLIKTSVNKLLLLSIISCTPNPTDVVTRFTKDMRCYEVLRSGVIQEIDGVKSGCSCANNVCLGPTKENEYNSNPIISPAPIGIPIGGGLYLNP